MKKLLSILPCVAIVGLLLPASSMAATEEAKQQAIDGGLAWLASTQNTSGTEGYWPYSNNGTLATTASAALAFIEDGYLPGADVVIGGTNYGDVVGKATNYIFNRATADSRFPAGGVEVTGYTRRAEDYNNDGVLNDGGNNQAIYFNPGVSERNVYTTGIVAPVVYALGEALGPDTTVGKGALTSTMTYREVMRDVVDWFSWGQVEPDRGNYRGGWRYDANYTDSDNSTAQWGSLPSLFGAGWGLETPQYVKNELELWVNYIQNSSSGGSGYNSPDNLVNMSKTGGLLLELSAIGAPLSDSRVQAALDYINTNWNQSLFSTWNGNFDNPYAMWALYKGLSEYGLLHEISGGVNDGVLYGSGIANAMDGINIGHVGDTFTAGDDDWYSHYSDYLVGLQNTNGSWSGASYWTGALATGWYINILNATGRPENNNNPPVPEATTMLLLGTGLIGLAGFRRRSFKK